MADTPEKPRSARLRWLLVPILLIAVVGAGLAVGMSLASRQTTEAPTGQVPTRPTILVVSPSPIPKPPQAGVTPSPSALPAPAEYVVQPGDTLRSIAQQLLGSPELWTRLYEENRDVIGADPNALEPGMRLRVRPDQQSN